MVKMRSSRKASPLIALVLLMWLGATSGADEGDLVWSTFLGGNDYDLGYGIATDGAGHVYVTGVTTSHDFPTKAGPADTLHGGRDVFVAKFNATGDTLIYATLLGGSDDDEGKDLAPDAAGHVYVTGVTVSDDFPVTPGAFGAIRRGLRDVVVAKLAPTGSSLEYATYLGGSDSDWGKGIAIDDVGNAHLTGYTDSENFPSTAGAFDTTYNGGSWDAFVVKLNSQGSSLEYATFLGGGDVDNGQDIALDGSGNAYVTGLTGSLDFPITTEAFDTLQNGSYDAFVAKFNPSGDSLTYSSYLGGSQADYAYGIVVDGSGSAHLTGKTVSVDFPTTAGAYDSEYGGGYASDVFVAKFNSTGNGLEYSTFMGGASGDEGRGIVLDHSGSACLAGYTWSEDFPTTLGAYSRTHSGYYSDAFMAKLSATGSALEYSTLLGGNSIDLCWDLAVDGAGYAYVTGETKSTDFPTTAAAFCTSITGNYADVFVVKLNIAETPVEFETSEPGLPKTYALLQNHPNPFNASTEIRYRIPEDCQVTLKIFNTMGREVRTLVDGHKMTGEYAVTWDGRNDRGREVGSGVYFCRLKAGVFCETVKMVVLR
jgi:hypothetical protein